MKKRLLAIALSSAMALSLMACGSSSSGSSSSGTSSAASTTAASEAAEAGTEKASADYSDVTPDVTLIAAHVNNEDSSFHYGMTQFKNKLEELSKGKMTVEIHPNGELGGDESELIEKVASNTVDCIIVSPGDLSNAVPQVDFLALPFIYQNVDQWKQAQESDDIGGYFAKFVDDNGAFHMLAYYMCGIRSVFSTKPLESMDDFKGVKIRVKSSENVVKIWTALGFVPASLAYNEIYSGLQNNVINAAENDIANILNMKFYEPAPNVTLTEHDYATRFLIIGSSKYNSLTDEQKQWVDEAAAYSQSLEWDYDEQYAGECQKQLEDLGVNFIQIDTTPMIETVQPILSEIADNLGVTAGYDAIKALQK